MDGTTPVACTAARSHRAAGGDEHEDTQSSFSRAGWHDAGRMARASARAPGTAPARNDGPGDRASGDGSRLRVRRRVARTLRNSGWHEPGVIPAGVFPNWPYNDRAPKVDRRSLARGHPRLSADG